MHGLSVESSLPETRPEKVNLRYLWMITFVAALGGLLFGYDWVVIGGAKPFYEAYFHLNSGSQIGWANSSALIGCFLGSLAGGRLSDAWGRRNTLLLSALLFSVSSICTGWSFSFSAFIEWRIFGGVAIGLASNISPIYIAEISPSEWRGRLVSLNQFGIVVGILAAQIANWRIARPVPAGLSAATMAQSWNVLYGWRWMFTAVAAPSVVFLLLLPFIPESPRWLISRHSNAKARKILARIGGERYGEVESATIAKSLIGGEERVAWRQLFRGPLLKLLVIGVCLAVLQQGSGINIIFNYAEEIYRSAGYGLNDILFNIVITGAINLVFTLVAMLTVDSFGRKPLMMFGCLAVGLCHLVMSFAYRFHVGGSTILLLTLGAVASYAMSLAPITWVLITEIFPNRYRGTGVSISVAALWLASFVLTYTFPIVNQKLGASGVFLMYALICLGGALFVAFAVRETKGRSLESMG